MHIQIFDSNVFLQIQTIFGTAVRTVLNHNKSVDQCRTETFQNFGKI